MRRPPEKPPKGLIFLKLTSKDLDLTHELLEACFKDIWPKQDTLSELVHPEAQVIGMQEETDSGLVAVLFLRSLEDKLWVFKVGVLPDSRRKGLGRELMQKGLQMAQEKGLELWLEVESGNKGAIALYKSLGFVQAGKRKGYYQPKNRGDSSQDALLFKSV